MHKAGGVIALIAGLFSIIATMFASLLAAASPVFDGALDTNDAVDFFVGGIFVSTVVIILSAIILGTRSRLPALLILAFSVFAISQGWGSGLVAICLAFAILGGLFAAIWRGV